MHIVAALVLGALLAVPSLGWSRAGTLDPTFATAGITNAPAPGSEQAYFGLEIEPDGRLVASGYTRTNPAPGAALVTRYRSDGSLDPTFGSGGFVTTPIGVLDVKLTGNPIRQPDGMVVVRGTTVAPGLPYEQHPIVLRYDSGGVLDPGFGAGGIVTLATDSAAGSFVVQRPLLQADGKIVLLGANGGRPGFMRLNSDGSIDHSFGVLGAATIAPGSGILVTGLVEPDGTILGIGAVAGVGGNDLIVARVDDHGVRDAGFGLSGVVVTDLGGDDEGYAVVRQPDGKLVVLGTNDEDASGDLTLVRYDDTGTLDPTFGTGGLSHNSATPFEDYAIDLLLEPDGKIVAGGTADLHNNGGGFLVARFQTDGSPDASFGAGGYLVYDPSPNFDGVNGLVRQDDGKLVAAGLELVSGYVVALARFDTSNRCSAAASASCKQSTLLRSGKLVIKHGGAPSDDTLTWKMTRAADTTLAELGAPATTTAWALCFYRPDGALAYEADAPPGGTCGSHPCWKSLGSKGFKYADRDATPDGVVGEIVKAGTGGNAQASATVKGANASPPVLPLALPARVQLQASNGTCFDTTFSQGGSTANSASRFTGKSD